MESIRVEENMIGLLLTIMILLMLTPDIANAPGPNDPLYRSSGGFDMFIGILMKPVVGAVLSCMSWGARSIYNRSIHSIHRWFGRTTVYHLAPNQTAQASVARGIDPKCFRPTNRFGGAFYASGQVNGARLEVLHHAPGLSTGQVEYFVKFKVNLSTQKVLDLTQPSVALKWGYTPNVAANAEATQYVVTRAIADRAMAQGYTVIKFPSQVNSVYTNYAFLPNTDFYSCLGQGIPFAK